MESTAALNSKIAALEDEMRIIKGEVKQVLTEIRSAILVQDSPFEEAVDSRAPRPIQIVPPWPRSPRASRSSCRTKSRAAPPYAATCRCLQHPGAYGRHARRPQPTPRPACASATGRMQPRRVPTCRAAPAQAESDASAPARWSLLTVASLAAWAEEALRQVGQQAPRHPAGPVRSLRLPDAGARQALARVTDLDVAGAGEAGVADGGDGAAAPARCAATGRADGPWPALAVLDRQCRSWHRIQGSGVIDKAITTVLLTIAAIVAIVAVINAVLPAVSQDDGIAARVLRASSRIASPARSKSSTRRARMAPRRQGLGEERRRRQDCPHRPHRRVLRADRRLPARALRYRRSCVAPCWYETLENATSGPRQRRCV